MTPKPNPVHLGLVLVLATVVALVCRSVFKSDWFEVAGFITGIAGVYLASQASIWNWSVGMVNVLIYAWVFFQAGLYADTTLQLVFFVLLIHGWWSWSKRELNQKELPITRLQVTHFIVIAVYVVLGTAIYAPVIHHFKGAAPVIDSMLFVMSVIAQILLNRKILHTWHLWIIINTIYIPLYFSKGLYVTVILTALYLVLAFLGLARWNREFNASRATG